MFLEATLAWSSKRGVLPAYAELEAALPEPQFNLIKYHAGVLKLEAAPPTHFLALLL